MAKMLKIKSLEVYMLKWWPAIDWKGGSITMALMVEKKKKAGGKGRKPNRTPSWKLYAMIDEDLEVAFNDYVKKFEYAPTIRNVVERALKDLFTKAGCWPIKKDE